MPRRRIAAAQHVVLLLTLVLMLLLCTLAQARCPSNGNTHVVYVTSNMGDNIWSFDTHGNYLGDVLDTTTFPRDVQVHKLRAMRFGPGGYLYVLSASGAYSRVFAVSGNGVVNHTLAPGCTRAYRFTVVQQDKANPLLDHPYDLAFHPVTGDMYVANQNSITITRYARRGAGKQRSNKKDDDDNSADDADGDYPTWQPMANVPGALPLSSSSPSLAAAMMASKKATSHAQTHASPDAAEGDNKASDGAGGSGSGDSRRRGKARTRKTTTASVTPVTVPDDTGLFASSWSASYTMDSIRGIALSPLLPRALIEDGATYTPPPAAAAATASATDGEEDVYDGNTTTTATAAAAANADAGTGKGATPDERRAMTYYLLACDVASNTLHVFDTATGERVFGISVPSPVQVVFPARYFALSRRDGGGGNNNNNDDDASNKKTARQKKKAAAAAGQDATAAAPAVYEVPYVYVTSREDGMVYLVRLSAVSSSVRGLAPLPALPSRAQRLDTPQTQQQHPRQHRRQQQLAGVDVAALRAGTAAAMYAATDNNNNHNMAYANNRQLQYYPVTRPLPLHSASGLYENDAHDTLLIGDRSGRKVSSYVSPFLTNALLTGGAAGGTEGDDERGGAADTRNTRGASESNKAASSSSSSFLGYFLRGLPDQPEFITMTLLETQANIPFCYELTASGTFRYAALCTAGYLWSAVLAVVLLVVPSVLLYKYARQVVQQQRRLAAAASSAAHDAKAETAPLMGGSACGARGGANSYGAC